MKPIERRKMFSTLHRLGRRCGVTIVEDPGAGSGSHGSLLFYSEPGVRPVRIIIVYARTISPGVQRAILKQLEAQAASRLPEPQCQLTRSVVKICRECFQSAG